MGGQVDLGLGALVRWGAKATGRKAGGRGAARDKAPLPLPTTPLAPLEPGVINEKAHRRTERAS